MVLPYIKMNPPQVYTCSPSWTLLPPPSPYHPFGSSQCTSPKHPVSCIKPGLATRFIYDIIHVSMPFSQINKPSPAPSPKDFYTSVSLFLPERKFVNRSLSLLLLSYTHTHTLPCNPLPESDGQTQKWNLRKNMYGIWAFVVRHELHQKKKKKRKGNCYWVGSQ